MRGAKPQAASSATTDHLHVVNQLIEKCQECKIPLDVGLVDYNRAFDSPTVEILDAIDSLNKEQGVEPVMCSSMVYNTSTNTPNPTSDITKTPNDSDCKGEYGSVIPVLPNCSLPARTRSFANYVGK